VSVVRSVFEARRHIGPKIAELAAERHGPELPALLDDAVRKLEVENDPVELQRHAIVFWDHIVDAADSIVFRLLYNALRAAYEPVLAELSNVMSFEVGRTEAYRTLADTIVSGDADAARQAAADLLEPATKALMATITSLEDSE
jgi:GntR family transcriptional regulator, transcriptional repressor for pyruvate dehydrogenase complex